jgi:hypothetical protein
MDLLNPHYSQSYPLFAKPRIGSGEKPTSPKTLFAKKTLMVTDKSS